VIRLGSQREDHVLTLRVFTANIPMFTTFWQWNGIGIYAGILRKVERNKIEMVVYR